MSLKEHVLPLQTPYVEMISLLALSKCNHPVQAASLSPLRITKYWAAPSLREGTVPPLASANLSVCVPCISSLLPFLVVFFPISWLPSIPHSNHLTSTRCLSFTYKCTWARTLHKKKKKKKSFLNSATPQATILSTFTVLKEQSGSGPPTLSFPLAIWLLPLSLHWDSTDAKVTNDFLMAKFSGLCSLCPSTSL